jgi:alkylated DNA repair dioxygenase AlkB
MPNVVTQRKRVRFEPLELTPKTVVPFATPKLACRHAAISYKNSWVTHDIIHNLDYVVAPLRALQAEAVSEKGPGWDKGDRRRTLQFGSTEYKYAGASGELRPFESSPVMLLLLSIVQDRTGLDVNFCLVNFYNHEGDLGWHQDNEAGIEGPIASLSFSDDAWLFRLRDPKDHSRLWDLWLVSGSLVVMGGDCQKELVHSVPKRKRPPTAWRVNLTFRKIV